MQRVTQLGTAIGRTISALAMAAAAIALAGCGDEVATAEVGCHRGGERVAIGATFEEGCNACVCGADERITCEPTDACVLCTHEGQGYTLGESYPAGDGCNICTCGAGGESLCTTATCGPSCDPATEWWRSYAATSPAECEVIDFECPPNTTSFGNACGCGCEQSSTCEQTYDCSEGACDPEQVAADCPYSTILE